MTMTLTSKSLNCNYGDILCFFENGFIEATCSLSLPALSSRVNFSFSINHVCFPASVPLLNSFLCRDKKLVTTAPVESCPGHRWEPPATVGRTQSLCEH